MADTWDRKEYIDRYNSIYGASEAEFLEAAETLELNGDDSLADFGCGDGSFLASAARLVGSALGVDASPHQAESARGRLAGHPHIEIETADFLSFRPGGRRFTKGYSRKALHHLDDAGKAAFFRAIGPAFAAGGLFLLQDGIFDFERNELDANWDRLMEEAAAYYGASWEEKKKDVLFCFRQEFPCGVLAWTAALEAGGFRVVKRERKSSFYGSLLARKER